MNKRIDKTTIERFSKVTMATMLVMAALFIFVPSALAGNSPATPETPRTVAVKNSTAQMTITLDEDDIIKQVKGVVQFSVNQANIPQGSSFLKELREEIQPQILQQHLELTKIEVRGAASPEGATANNERLAVARTRVLVDSIRNIIPSAGTQDFSTSCITEDYERLVELMKEAGDADYHLVSQAYEKWKDSPQDLKWTLMTAKNRQLWPRLLRQYFPSLRATHVTLTFRAVKPAVEEPEPIVTPQCEGCTDCNPTTCKCTDCKCTTCCCIVDGERCFCKHIPQPETKPDTITIVEHRRPILAISTNLLYDAFYMPDYGLAPMWNGKLEIYPRRSHFTYAFGFINPYWHKWAEHKFFQIRNYEFETRWYHRFDRNSGQRWGWYLGAALDCNKYGIGLSDLRGWQGEGFGAQITGGYVLPISKCKGWKLEFNLGAGFYQTNYDPYIYEDPFYGQENGHNEYNPPTYDPVDKYHYYYKWYGEAQNFKKRQYRYRWLGPTQIGVSLKYDFLWKRKARHGASFRHTETRKEVSND